MMTINQKCAIFTAKAPKPVGTYSQAVTAGHYVFVSGQIPIEAGTGEVLSGSITDKTRLIFRNIAEILAQAGCGLEDIVKVSVFMTDLNEFGAVNNIFREIFTDTPPARETLQVVALPMGVDIELSVIAISRPTKDGDRS